MNKTMILVMTAALSVASSAQVAPTKSLREPASRQSKTDSLPEDSRAMELLKEMNDLRDRGQKAEAKGDLKQAELIYIQATQILPDTPYTHIHLARLYDKTGRERQALAQYRIVVVGTPRSRSSTQSDPRVLSRFGDLSAKFGREDDARRAYALATREVTKSSTDPYPEPRNASLGALKAAAHTAAAIKCGQVDDEQGELRELSAAVAADGGDWVPRYYRAQAYKRLGNQREAIKEVEAAQRLAPSTKERTTVAGLRERRGF